MFSDARVVIIGSGICGSSLAYHLSEQGWSDVVVLEQGALRSGTTSHAPGLVGQLRASPTLTRMLMDSVALYEQLSVDGQPGYFPVGSLRLASSVERWQELKRQAGFARAVGLEAELLSLAECQPMVPWLNWNGVFGALYLPRDGSARAGILAEALAQRAQAGGVTFYPQTTVTDIELKDGRVAAVVTSQGRIRTEIVVVAAGIWSPRIGRMVGVSIPLSPMQHQYARSGPLPVLDEGRPVPNVRDPDRLVYFRQDGRTLAMGGYERNPAAFDVDAIGSSDNPTVKPFDPPRFQPLLEALNDLVPDLGQPVEMVNGLESFTPDGEFLLGPSPQVPGFWMACGFCAHGVSGAGGVGKQMAHWIVHGEPELDLWHMDMARLGRHTGSRRFVARRIDEIYSTYYDISYPGQERISQRGLRLSPIYSRLQALDATFGEKSGWERPNWFTRNTNDADYPAPEGWAGRNWSSAIGVEHQACREAVALFDESSFSKIEAEGPDALVFLQRICANQMDKAVGTVTYTQMLNQRGGIECDLTVTRLGENRFQLITGTAFGQHDLAWMQRQLRQNPCQVTLRDTTSSLCCVGAWGPRSRELMAAVSEDDFSNQGFPYLTARQVRIEEVPALAVRVTYVGELGWELYAPTEYGARLWDVLWQAGQSLGIVAAGYRAIDSLRLEKGYRYWSADIDSETNPYEAGLGFAVKLDKGDFVGRLALQTSKARGLARKLCALVLDRPTAVALGGEPILSGARVLGRVTSAGYGYTLQRSLAYGYLPIDSVQPGTRVEVEIFGERVGAAVTREPLYDPGNLKIKA